MLCVCWLFPCFQMNANIKISLLDFNMSSPLVLPHKCMRKCTTSRLYIQFLFFCSFFFKKNASGWTSNIDHLITTSYTFNTCNNQLSEWPFILLKCLKASPQTLPAHSFVILKKEKCLKCNVNTHKLHGHIRVFLFLLSQKHICRILSSCKWPSYYQH